MTQAEKPERELTAKERLFIIAMYDPRTTGTAAAIAAGYAPKTAVVAASRLLSKVNIRVLIDKGRAEFFAAQHMSAEECLAEIAKIARFNMGRIVHVTSEGDPFIDLNKATDDDMAALAEVSIEDFTQGRGDDAREVRRVKAKSFNKLDALKTVALALGLMKPTELKLSLTDDFVEAMAAAERRAVELRNQGQS